MSLRHGTRALRGGTRASPGARHEASSLPTHPAFSVAAPACPGRHREGRAQLGRPRRPPGAGFRPRLKLGACRAETVSNLSPLLMCGIVGYVGRRPCEELLLQGLEKLEYRGYDSAGISMLENGEVESVHAVGNLANLRAAVEKASNGNGSLIPAHTGIAHTRWATPGRVTEENAHPHDDSTGKVHIVLNGIVENHAELRKRLIAEGEEFSSETDAEVVAPLTARHYDGDLAAATRDAYADQAVRLVGVH